MESSTSKRSSKLSKCNMRMGVYSADRINKLPDELLENILSRLTMREAVGSSLISRRWKHLWTYTTGSFDFDFGSAALTALKQKPRGFTCICNERIRYIERVHKILKSHRGPTMDAFVIKFDLITYSTKHINTWIDFAIRKRVRRLELDLRRVDQDPQLEHAYLSDVEIKLCYTFPSLESLDKTKKKPNLSWLTNLNLNTVNMSRETVEYIFSNCPVLEYVRIIRSPSLSGVRVVATCPKLKHLEIAHCQCLEFLDFSSAPNLMSLSYSGPEKTRLCFRDVPNLVDVSLQGQYCKGITRKFHELPLALSQIQKLKLSLTMEMYLRFNKFPELKSVTELELEFKAIYEHSLLSCTYAIEACPNLCSLSVQLNWVRKSEQQWISEPELAKGKSYKRLKVVELSGFRASKTDVELATYIFSTAPLLEKIIVNTIHSDCTIRTTRTNFGENLHAKNVVLQLVAQFSPAAQLIIS